MAKIRVAQIDANNQYIGMVEVEEAELTDRHLVAITECDLQPNAGHRWVPDAANPFGGAFVPPPRKTPEQKFNDAAPLPALCCFFIRAWKRDPESVPPATLAWMRGYVDTFDFKTVLASEPEAQEFHRWARDQENKS